jgi:hypothetical protein
MAAPQGNQYWKLAHNFRKPKKLTPDEVIDKALEYATWCEENPLIEEKVFGTGVKMEVNKLRAMTIQGFCLFANIRTKTFYEYEKDEAYSNITACVKDLFYAQKLEGAAADLLNPNIIARELGLKDTQEIDHLNNGNSFNSLTDAELVTRLGKLLEPGKKE